MEMQRHAQLMYTSCGWFFDDISGIETVQVIAYAARVLQLARELFGEQAAALEPAFLARLAEARSNVPSAGNGADIYKACVASQGAGSGTSGGPLRHQQRLLLVYRGDRLVLLSRSPHLLRDLYLRPRTAGAGPGANCQRHHRDSSRASSFAVLHFGDQNITAAVKAYKEADAAEFEAFAKQAAEQVQRADFPEVIRLLDRYYGHVDYSLTSLFTDEQRRIVQLILNSTL